MCYSSRDREYTCQLECRRTCSTLLFSSLERTHTHTQNTYAGRHTYIHTAPTPTHTHAHLKSYSTLNTNTTPLHVHTSPPFPSLHTHTHTLVSAGVPRLCPLLFDYGLRFLVCYCSRCWPLGGVVCRCQECECCATRHQRILSSTVHFHFCPQMILLVFFPFCVVRGCIKVLFAADIHVREETR